MGTETTPPILYWFENRQLPPPGCADRFGDFVEVQPGRYWQDDPRRRGLMCARHKGFASVADADFAHYTWTRLAPAGPEPAAKSVWIGARAGVIPSELRKDTDGRGYPVLMGDGQHWTIPVLDIRSANCTLPCQDFLIDGEWRPVPRAQYRPLSDRALSLAGSFRAAKLKQADLDWGDDADNQIRELIVDALGLHYDLNVYEASALGLFAPEVYLPAIRAIIDWHTTEQLLQALTQEGNGGTNPFADTTATSSTSSGAPDYSTLTSQPAPTPGSSPSPEGSPAL